MTDSPPSDPAQVLARPRFHVEGQTSTEGRRWQIWDGEKHFARFQNIADQTDAHNICEVLNTRTIPPTAAPGELVERLGKLAAFLSGQGDLDGLWFGDGKQMQNGYKARFWWRRSHLPALAEAAAHITTLEATIARLSERAEGMARSLRALEQAEATYRYIHDTLGGDDRKTGRAWDLMRRAGDDARFLLRSELPR